MSKFWGYSLMLDCAECNDNISSKEVIHQFITTLVKEIDMAPFGEPIIEFLLPGDEKQGYSLVQLITTSNITAHFMDFDKTAYFDIFSCTKYNIDIVEEVVRRFFDPKKIRKNFITRNA